MSNWIMLSKSSLVQMNFEVMWAGWNFILFPLLYQQQICLASSSSEPLFPQERCELYRHGRDVSSAQLWPKVVPRRGCDAKDGSQHLESRFIEAALKSILDHGLRRTPAYVPRCLDSKPWKNDCSHWLDSTDAIVNQNQRNVWHIKIRTQYPFRNGNDFAVCKHLPGMIR